nr:hypothetical protein [Tanacetum cinerariifolium]
MSEARKRAYAINGEIWYSVVSSKVNQLHLFTCAQVVEGGVWQDDDGVIGGGGCGGGFGGGGGTWWRVVWWILDRVKGSIFGFSRKARRKSFLAAAAVAADEEGGEPYSYEVPASAASTATTDTASDGIDKKKGRTVTVTVEDIQKRKNDFMDVEIEQDDLNHKFLTSLAPKWLMHTIVWRNRSDLDTMSLDDLYNHLKVYESEVQKKSEPNPQNIAFISSAKHSRGNEDVNIASVSTASTNIPTASANIRVASISQDTAYDIEEIDIKWNMALLSMRADKFWKKTGKKISIQGSDVARFDKSKVECFNCHKMGQFAKECRAPRSQDRGRRDNYRNGSKVEEQAPKALMAIDEVYLTTLYALKTKLGLTQVESRLVEHRDREIKYCEKIRGLELEVEFKTNSLECLAKELETLKKEKERLDGKLAGFETASKDLDSLLESQRLDKNKEGLGYSAVPPLPAQIYSSPKKDMSWTSLPEFNDDTVTDYSRPAPTVESFPDDAQNRNPSVTETEPSSSTISPKSFIKFVKANDSPTNSKTDKAETAKKPPVKYAEQYRKPTKKHNVRGNQRNWNNLKSHQLGPNFVMKKNACFNCGNFNHLAYDCRKRVKNGTSRSQNNTHKSFTPRPVVHKPYIPPMRPMRSNMNGAQPNRTSLNKPTHSYTNRPFQRTSAVRSQYRAPWVPTVNKKFSLLIENFPLLVEIFPLLIENFPLLTENFPLVAQNFPLLIWERREKRCDNGGEFRNKEMNDFCSQKGIKREFSNARTPQQNGVTERRNRTLIEAARTMLVDAKLHVSFWAEAVNTACYVQNRVLVNKSQNKTPYELFNRKFGAKEDEGYFIGYSMSSKAFRVQILLTFQVHDALLESSSSKPQDDCSTDVPESSGNFNPTATSTNPPADQLETITVETPISTPLLVYQFQLLAILTLQSPQEEGIDYDEVFALVARIEAVRLFLAYASFMGFIVYQMDVNSAFLYGIIDKEVGTIDQTLFIRRQRGDSILVQVYVDDIIFRSSNPQLCREFEALMHEKIQMSAMGELNFFLGLQVLQKEDGIFLSQDKYVGDILKKFRYLDVRLSNTPMDKENPWGKYETGKDVDLHLYRSMIRSLMHQVTPKECYLHTVKRIFRYLKGHPKLGLWYPEESSFDLVAYSDSDYGGATQDCKSTTGGCQFLGRRLSMPCEALSKEISSSMLRLCLTIDARLHTAKTSDLIWMWLGGDYRNVFLMGFNGIQCNKIMARLQFCDYHNMVAILEKIEHNIDFHPIVDFVEASPLMILTTVDGILRTVIESSLRRNLKLQDEEGISPKSTGFNKFSSNIATALVCLATNRVYNFSKMIFDGLVKNVNNKVSKFLMYPSPSFSGRIVPLFDTMLVPRGEGSGTPTEPHHTPSPEAQQTSSTTPSSPTLPSITTAPIPTVTPSDTPTLRQYTRRARIAQSLALLPVADKHASSLRDVSEGKACPTDSGFVVDQDRANIAKSSTLPHDSAPKVTSPAGDEG